MAHASARGETATTPMTTSPTYSTIRSELPDSPRQSAGRNRLLDALPPRVVERILPLLEPVPLPEAMTIHEPLVPIAHFYFVCTGVISMVSEMDEGTVEVGIVGPEGMTGLPLVLGATTMAMRAFVQVRGDALRMRSDDLLRTMRDSPRFERLLRRYALALFDQTAQHAACNRLHTLEARCARWLLMSHDRVDGDVLSLKQQFLAEMLGVHRPAVTLAAGALQRAGVIRYARGKVTVLDRSALERASCRCYRIIARRVEELLSGPH
jgi:CRP-like cAMP-binding protein